MAALSNVRHTLRIAYNEPIMKKIMVITGASSGFGRLAAESLAKAGHTVYASMRATAGRSAPVVAQKAEFSRGSMSDLLKPRQYGDA
jgi:NAD(P)-dependent dehydrogenase (short-subunit alcohol dehydrogenase family)